MIERNFKNNIIWEEPDGDLLSVEVRDDQFNQEQIANLFNLNFTGGLSGGDEVLAVDAGPLINVTSISLPGIPTVPIVGLLNESEGPYDVLRNGTVIEQNESAFEFPFLDVTIGLSGEQCYTIEDAAGNTSNEACITV